jgi:hypothetical protein
MARSVLAKCRVRRKNMAAMHSASSSHSHTACCTQKKGRRSSRMSRSVPPPKAARPATTHTPTASSFLRAAAISPDSAKATVAAASIAICAFDSDRTWVSGEKVDTVRDTVVQGGRGTGPGLGW